MFSRKVSTKTQQIKYYCDEGEAHWAEQTVTIQVIQGREMWTP